MNNLTRSTNTICPSQSTIRFVALTLALLLSLGHMLLAPTPLAAAPATSELPFRYFYETGHSISGDIKTFYDRNGGLPIFGLPLTEVITDGELRVQYFERARFEIVPQGI